MVHRSEDATALLGMSGFVVGAQALVDGEWWLHVETDTGRAACPECGTWAKAHGRRRVKVGDLPISGRPVVLCWSKRIWRCADPDCDKATWSETTDTVRPRAALTERARAEMCRRVGEDGDSVAQVARGFGVGWHTAMEAIRSHGRPLIDNPARTAATTAMGVDETVFLHANRTRHTRYVTGMVDLDRALLLDVVEGRSGRVLGDWLDSRPQAWRDQIAIAALDPFRGYATALRSRLPAATVVIDHFHAVKLANSAIDDVRRRVQHDVLGHRGRKGDPLYGIRRLLLVGSERLTERGWERIHAALAAGDPEDEVAAALAAKEHLRAVYAARSQAGARRQLRAFYKYCAAAEVPELTRMAKTVTAWEDEILAYHRTAMASNGPTEAVNLLIENVRRTAYGFRNFDNYRLRLLLTCGIKWHTPIPARIRGRKPRLVA